MRLPIKEPLVMVSVPAAIVDTELGVAADMANGAVKFATELVGALMDYGCAICDFDVLRKSLEVMHEVRPHHQWIHVGAFCVDEALQREDLEQMTPRLMSAIQDGLRCAALIAEAAARGQEPRFQVAARIENGQRVALENGAIVVTSPEMMECGRKLNRLLTRGCAPWEGAADVEIRVGGGRATAAIYSKEQRAGQPRQAYKTETIAGQITAVDDDDVTIHIKVARKQKVVICFLESEYGQYRDSMLGYQLHHAYVQVTVRREVVTGLKGKARTRYRFAGELRASPGLLREEDDDDAGDSS